MPATPYDIRRPKFLKMAGKWSRLVLDRALVPMPELFALWCHEVTRDVNGHQLTLLTEREVDGRQHALPILSDVAHTHYENPDRIARNIARWGFPRTAAALQRIVPESARARSGDLGEILATEYVDESLMPYRIPIRRLRWKDGREMAMRGDDLIGIAQDASGVRFLKGECKSRQLLSASVITEARKGLNSNNGLPTEHALTFVSRRLFELGRVDESDMIDDHLLDTGIRHAQMLHLFFVFVGNDATILLEADLITCGRQIAQRTVALQIADHADFTRTVYEGMNHA